MLSERIKENTIRAFNAMLASPNGIETMREYGAEEIVDATILGGIERERWDVVAELVSQRQEVVHFLANLIEGASP
jgi:hypothetical protein